MMRGSRLLALALICGVAALLSADEIHLLNGRSYRVAAWRIDGESLIMTLPDGRSITVPRASVLRIAVDGTGERIETTQPAVEEDIAAPAPILDIAIPEAVLYHLERGNIAAALNVIDASDESYRQSTDAMLLRGSLLARAGYPAEAVAVLSSVSEAEEQYPGARFTRAQALIMLGRWDEARVLLLTLAERDDLGDLREAARSRLALIDQFTGRTQRAGEGLLVVASDPALAERTLALAIEALVYLRQALQFDPPQDLLVIVEDNPPPGAAAHEGKFDGVVRISARGAADVQAERLVTHELVHALLLPRTRGNAPAWLHEGLACQLSGQSLFGGPVPEESDYRDGLGLVEYLIQERGEASLMQFFDTLASGQDEESGLLAVYGAPIDELRRRRDLWLRGR